MLGFLAVFAASIVINGAEPCITPLGQQSECVAIKECPEIINRISLDQRIMDFVRQSKCGCDVLNPRICCGPIPNNWQQNGLLRGIDVDEFEDSNLASNNQCGKELLSYGDRIYSGTRTEIGEFPWLALLWYRKWTGQLEYKCGGMLINRRYVLTAAHCVLGQEVEVFSKIESVSLGEQDVRNATDCIDGVCSGPPQIVPVLATYPHPGYNDTAPNRHNDIALIRLARRVQYTDVVQPICLDRSGQWDMGDEVVVAGWGRTLEGIYSPEKLKVSLSIADKTYCTELFRYKFEINITNSQVCVGGEFLKDSCNKDSGGPVMRQKGGQWEAIALVSFGYGCGRDNWPAVYTKTSSYYDWILETLQSSNICTARYRAIKQQ